MTLNSASQPQRRIRRTQEERSDLTRQKILDATLACLQEYGYARTTTMLICDRAGVSRGAQVHHYRSKFELVVAALGHLSDALLKQYETQLAAIPTGMKMLDAYMAAIWKTIDDPLFIVAFELYVAARTEPELRQHVEALVAPIGRHIDTAVHELAIALRPDDPQELEGAIHLLIHLIQGFALDKYAFNRRARNERLYMQACGFVKAIASKPIEAVAGRAMIAKISKRKKSQTLAV